MRYAYSVPVAALALLFTGACDSFAPPVSPDPVDRIPSPAPMSQGRVTSDDELARIAREEIPGFAGYYVDRDGTAILRLVDPAQQSRTETYLAADLARVRQGRMRFAPNRTLVRPASFDFAQLKGWSDQLTPLLQRDNIYLIDVDEVENRVMVGVGDVNAVAEVRREATRLGIPASAVHVQTQPRPTPRATVQDWHNPLTGGIQIAFSSYLCTLGFNARLVSTQQPIFVTNSHCTNTYFGFDGGTIYQNLNAAGNAVGVEVADIAASPNRYADAAYIAHNGSRTVSRGIISRTNWATGGPGGLTIIGQFQIVGWTGSIPVGTYLDKTGQTSGSTYGVVTNSCVTIGPLLCQDVSTVWSEGGDSGSPVYVWVGGASGWDVALVGVMWGGPGNNYNVTYSSRLAGIVTDLGMIDQFCIPSVGC